MANLATVQEQIQKMKDGNTPSQKEIFDAQAFIATERRDRPSTNASLESFFIEWETLIEKKRRILNDESKAISAKTGAELGAAKTDVTKDSSSLETIRSEVGREFSILTDLEIEHMAATASRVETIVSGFEKLNPSQREAARGMLGFFLIQRLHLAGYQVTLTGEKIRVISLPGTKANQSQAVQLETFLANNPKMRENIGYGLIYGSSEFKNYADAHRNTDGSIISPTRSYLDYLSDAKRGQNNNQLSLNDQALLASRGSIEQLLKNQSTVNGLISGIPRLEDALQAGKKDPEKMKQVGGTMNKAMDEGGKNEGAKEKSGPSQKKDNAFTKILGKAGLTVEGGFSDIINTKGAPLAILIAFLGTWIFKDFKSALGVALGALGISSVANAVETNKHEGQKVEKQEEGNGKPRQNETIDKSYSTQFNTFLQIAYHKPDISKERETLEKIQDINYESLRTYVMERGAIPKEIETIVKDSGAKEMIDTYVQYIESKNDAIATRLKIMRESEDQKEKYKTMTLKQINEKLYNTESQFKGAISEIEKAIASSNDPQEKEGLQTVLASLKQAQASGNPETIQEALGIWDMLWGNKGKIALGVFAFYLVKKIGLIGGALNLVSGTVSTVYNTFSYGLRLIFSPIKTVKAMPTEIKAQWEKLAKDTPKPPKSTFGEKIKGAASSTADLLQGGIGTAEFEHMDGLKSHLQANNIDPKILEEFQGKVQAVQKLHPGSANYLKGENELRVFLNNMDEATVNAIRSYSEAGKFMAPEQGKFARTLVSALDDAKKLPIASRSARFIVSFFKKI